MALFRTTLREATVSMLMQMGRFQEVFNARAPVIMRDHLPCARVWIPSDTMDNLAIRGTVTEARGHCSMHIQIVIEGPDDVANARTLDEHCDAVLYHLLEDAIYLRLFQTVSSYSTDIETNVEGETRTLSATMRLEVEYGVAYETKIPDYLDLSWMKVPIPGQPTPPAGQEPHDVEIQTTYPRT